MTYNVAKGMEGAFSTFFQSIFDNTKSWQEKMAGLFKSLADSFIKALSDMAAKALVTNLFGGSTGGLGSLLGLGGGGETMYSPLEMQHGGDFWVNRPTPILVGEGGQREHVSITPENKMKETRTAINIINVIDQRQLDMYMASSAGQNAVLNVIGSQSGTVKRLLR